jgi:hypothetical protein
MASPSAPVGATLPTAARKCIGLVPTLPPALDAVLHGVMDGPPNAVETLLAMINGFAFDRDDIRHTGKICDCCDGADRPSHLLRGLRIAPISSPFDCPVSQKTLRFLGPNALGRFRHIKDCIHLDDLVLCGVW